MNARIIIFYLINYIIIFLGYIPNHFTLLGTYFPALDIMFIFYFYSYRDIKLSYSFIFLISLIIDSINQNILGTTALTYFLIIFIFSYQQKIFFFKSFKEIWFAFFCFALQYFLLEAFLTFFTTENNFNIALTIIRFLLTLSLYPVLHIIYQSLARNLIKQYDA